MKYSNFLFLIFAVVLLFTPNYFCKINHTEVEIINKNNKHIKNCSPEIFVKIKKSGIENVISSCLIQKNPFVANCTSKKLFSNIKLKAVCINSTPEKKWIVTLYGKHTLFHIPKIELINETLK